jgi:glutathione S-transferase
MLIYTSFVTILVSAYYLGVGLLVGKARQKFGISAPLMTGAPEVERALRVQANAVEFAPIVFPALWLAAYWTSDVYAALLGLVWVIGRIIYAKTYMDAANKRTLGFMIQMTATTVLWLMALGGIVMKLVHG